MAEHYINTGDAVPVRLLPYRLSHSYHQIVKDELNKMLASIIEPSNSDWSAPIVLMDHCGSVLIIDV